jgi:hypothetical protein
MCNTKTLKKYQLFDLKIKGQNEVTMEHDTPFHDYTRYTYIPMTKTPNQIILFFPPPNSEKNFQQHWESEYFFRKKKHNPPPFKLNGRSLTCFSLQIGQCHDGTRHTVS